MRTLGAGQDHPTPTPEANQPKKRIQRIFEWWLRFCNSPWLLPPLLIAFNIYLLFSELRLTTPVTRWTLIGVSGDVAAIWYGVVLFFLNILWQGIKGQWKINRMSSEMQRGLIDIVENLNRTQSDIIGFVTKQGESPNPPRRPSRLLAAIKALLGE